MITITLIVIGAIIIVTIAFVFIARSGGKPVDRTSGADGTGTTSGFDGDGGGDGGD